MLLIVHLDEDRVEFHLWAPAVAMSGALTPLRHLTLLARWRREPTFDAVREFRREPLSISSQPAQVTRHDVRFRVPRAYALGAIVSARATTFTTEVAREQYEGVFSPILSATDDPNYMCGLISNTCGGWGFSHHETIDTTTVKAGVEHRFRVRSGRVAIRGGMAHEPGYTLARRADDVSTRRGLMFPAPPVVTAFEPPREAATWLSAGVGYRGRRTEVAIGLGRTAHQMRLLVDLRLHSP